MKRLAAWTLLASSGAWACATDSVTPADDAASGGSFGDDAGASGGSLASSGGAVSAGGGTAASSGGAASGGTGTGGAGTGGSLAAGGTGGAVPVLTALTVFLAGDSTVSTYADTASTKDQAGWGQMFDAHFDELVTVQNRAVGGRTARRFIEEGSLAAIWEDIAPGDYLFVQFGTNDSNKSATYTLNNQTIPYYLAPDTDFKTYLMQYVDGARERQATVVLVTPTPRNSAYCTGGNGTGAYAKAMRDLGAAEGVLVADLNDRTVSYLKAICPSPTPEDFFLLRADGTVDGTHFQENGARILSSFVAAELLDLQVGIAGARLADYLVE